MLNRSSTLPIHIAVEQLVYCKILLSEVERYPGALILERNSGEWIVRNGVLESAAK